jgi:hypothetical protein
VLTCIKQTAIFFKIVMTWKGRLCKFFADGGYCAKGRNCAFAHGPGDIKLPPPGMVQDIKTGHWSHVTGVKELAKCFNSLGVESDARSIGDGVGGVVDKRKGENRQLLPQQQQTQLPQQPTLQQLPMMQQPLLHQQQQPLLHQQQQPRSQQQQPRPQQQPWPQQQPRTQQQPQQQQLPPQQQLNQGQNSLNSQRIL